MRIDFIADTNFLIYVHEGNELVTSFLDYNFGVSFITEIELLGFPNLSEAEEGKLRLLIGDCFNIEMNSTIKAKTIELRRIYTIKLPDAIIAATAMIYQVPLVTADKNFSRINHLDLIIIEP